MKRKYLVPLVILLVGGVFWSVVFMSPWPFPTSILCYMTYTLGMFIESLPEQAPQTLPAQRRTP